MAMSLNKVQIIGTLGKDPEVRSAGQKSVTSFSVACSEKIKKDGEWVEETEWFNVTVWNEGAQKLATYLSKGSSVYVEGKLKTRKWEKDGVTRYSTDVVVGTYDGSIKLLDRAEKSEKREPERARPSAAKRTVREFSEAELDDEIPF